MNRLLFVLLTLCLAATALAVQDPASNRQDNTSIKGEGDGAATPRTGGDTIESATIILSLPYSDTGATCGYDSDYRDCVFNTGAPDVVYAYTSLYDGRLTVSLCGSSYDTALWIYAGNPGNTVGCNDDYCDLQSQISNLQVYSGVTYYIVISGYAESCGSYTLTVIPQLYDCFCQPGIVPEGEGPCSDNYVDNYNGGCNSTGWTVIAGDADGTADICGLTGTYLYYGAHYRDTDWYEITGSGEVVTFECWGEFALQTIFIYTTDCLNLQYDITQVPACVTAELQHYVGAGEHAWLWVGPSVFTGLPCGTSHANEYQMHVTGLEPGGQEMGACCTPNGRCALTTQPDCLPPDNWLGPEIACEPLNPCVPVPVTRTTWGRIKATQR